MDPAGWNVLIGSYLPRLRQFAQRHLPAGGRGAIGADDVVQEAVMKSLRQLHRFEFRHDGAFLAYLRKSIRHRIVDEIRRAHRRPALISLSGLESIDWAVSPLERLIAKITYAALQGPACETERSRPPLDRLAGGARAVVRRCRGASRHAHGVGGADGNYARHTTTGRKSERSGPAANASCSSDRSECDRLG